MLFLKILSIVFPVFCIIAAGYIFAALKKIDIGSIIEVLLYLTIPALVVSSLARKTFVAEDVVLVTVSAAAVVLCNGLISLVYLSAVGRRDLRGFYLPTMFMNSGNMGFPLALLAFGDEGLSVAVLYFVAVSILVYSLGIYIAKGDGGFTEIFRLPLIYATILGLVISLGNIRLPGPVLTTFDMLGAATIPLMQLGLGYQLYSTRLASPGHSLAASLIRIGGGFIIALIVVNILGIEGTTRKVIILASSMPSAVINFVMSYRYGLQSDLVASTVALSTILSVFSTPLVLAWLLS